MLAFFDKKKKASKSTVVQPEASHFNFESGGSKIILQYHDVNGEVELFDYQSVHKEALCVIKVLNELLSETVKKRGYWTSCNVAILLPTHSPALLPAIIGTANTDAASCFIDINGGLNHVLNQLRIFKTNIIISDRTTFKEFQFRERCKIRSQYELLLADRFCVVLQLELDHGIDTKQIPIDSPNVMGASKILFSVTTSETCGEEKVIGVTCKCFMTNVKSLSKTFHITDKDVIFVSSPQTFHPFMLDVFLAMVNSAALIMVHNSIRLAPQELSHTLFPSPMDDQNSKSKFSVNSATRIIADNHIISLPPGLSHISMDDRNFKTKLSVTFMQMTPSLFMRWTETEIRYRVLAPSSTLRHLAIGGEPFPATSIIVNWQDWFESSAKAVYNLYGLTEMSCWACIYKVDITDITLNKEIPIGDPIDDTIKLEVSTTGEVLIKSCVRKCYHNEISDADVVNPNFEFTLHTGDLVDAQDPSRLVFKSRINDVIKFYGKKVDLKRIETIAREVYEVKDAACAYDSTRKRLILFVIIDSEADFRDVEIQIIAILQDRNIDLPFSFQRVNQFQLSAHGKISKLKMLEDYTKKLTCYALASKDFLETIDKILNTRISYLYTEDDDTIEKRTKNSLYDSFTFLGGTSLKAIELVNELEQKTGKQLPQLLPLLLNKCISIKDIIEQLNDDTAVSGVFEETGASQSFSDNSSACICKKNSIDGAATIYSHSKPTRNVSTVDGSISSKMELGDRTEGQVVEPTYCIWGRRKKLAVVKPKASHFNFESRGSKIILQYHDVDGVVELFDYLSVHKEALCVIKVLNELLSETVKKRGYWTSCNVAILLPTHSPALLPAIIGTANTNAASCFIDINGGLNHVLNQLRIFKTNIIISDRNVYKEFQFRERCKIKSQYELHLANRFCVVLQLELDHGIDTKQIPIDSPNVMDSSKILFSVTTSGTCGEEKVIGVPYKCFMTNVKSLSKTFHITDKDVIFVSSPQTFDPFMLDVFLAMVNSAALIMVHNSIRLTPQQLSHTLFPSPMDDQNSKNKLSVTFMQMTPSLFMRWTETEIRNRVLAPTSTLRHLAIGGEPFPATSIIANWQDWFESSAKAVYNLYGLTEMSCWACIYKVDITDITLNKEIPIGDAIDDTIKLEVSTTGEVLIKSCVRKCYHNEISDADVVNPNFEFILHTGDLVDAQDPSRLVFKSRINDVIKFYGKKVDLKRIETIAREVYEVKDAACAYDSTRKRLILFVIIDSEADFRDVEIQIIAILQDRNIDLPFSFQRVNQFQLSAHGKISKLRMLEDYTKKLTCVAPAEYLSNDFLEIIDKILNTRISYLYTEDDDAIEKRTKNSLYDSFTFLGGTSLKAIELVDELEQKTGKQLPQLLPLLLNECVSIKDIIEQLNIEQAVSGVFEETDTPQSYSVNSSACICWSVNMKKCIDAAVTVCNLPDDSNVISVGSHSKLLYNISAADGSILSSIELGDRIEGQVVQYNDCIMVGCYDGYLYCIDIVTGCEKWRLNSFGMIKCRPLIIESRVIFGNYASGDNLWCINAANGELIWAQRLGTKSIYSNPVIIDELDFIVCTLDGIVARISSPTGTDVWIVNNEVPIFSTPTVIKRGSENYVVFTRVDGSIRCLNNDGITIWNHDINANVFSSFECVENGKNSDILDLIFGAHNHSLYCLSFDITRKTCTERWNFQSDSPIRATPKLLHIDGENYIVCCSSNGRIYLNNLKNGLSVRSVQIDGELFSSPAILGSKVFIGSRNNCLYCIDCVPLLTQSPEQID